MQTWLRVRSKLRADELAAKEGKVLGPADYDVLLTGPSRVVKPDSRPLCVYLPGVLREHTQDQAIYDVLHGLRRIRTDNRGPASATERLQVGNSETRSNTKPTPSALVGAMEGSTLTNRRYCRLTAWTGRHLPQFETLVPLLRAVAREMAAQVPDRFAAQMAEVERTQPEWVIDGTPFTTVTVNNTWPTGMHTDKGDLDAGFSSIAVLRRGSYTGGELIFPEYRVAVDLRDGDLILMDAHDWHANAPIVCAGGYRLWGWCDPSDGGRTQSSNTGHGGLPGCGAERISVVSYFRTGMVTCGTVTEEARRAAEYRER